MPNQKNLPKGNALVGQSGGPTSVINSSLCGVIQRAQKSKNIQRVLGMSFGIEGFMKDEVVDLGKEDPAVIEGLRRTPGSALGSARHKVKDEDFPRILEQFKKYDIRYFFLAGGNDTMDTIHRVEKYMREHDWELYGVGVPKTVDNDLFGTDHTPGFPSAARFTALSVLEAGRLACDMQRVDRYVIYQSIGREAGWLTASSAAARRKEGDAPHLIYCPERKLNKEKFLADVKKTIEKWGFASIAVSEGLLWEDGTPVSSAQTKDKFGNLEFGAMGGGSVALTLHKLIAAETGYRGEFQITESLPMSAIDRATPEDLEEGYQCGVKAVELAEAGTSGVMVTLERVSNEPYRVAYGTTPLSNVAVHAKPMDAKYINAEGNDVTPAFLDYIRPLVGPMPEFSVLKKIHA
jgi:6-phosphofructokinase 1